MLAVDELNERFGNDVVQCGIAPSACVWRMRLLTDDAFHQSSSLGRSANVNAIRNIVTDNSGHTPSGIERDRDVIVVPFGVPPTFKQLKLFNFTLHASFTSTRFPRLSQNPAQRHDGVSSNAEADDAERREVVRYAARRLRHGFVC
jgi:hypothetical protein